MTKRVLFICFFFHSLTPVSHGSINPLLFDIVANMCPFTSYCHSYATRNLKNGEKPNDLCCPPCSCELDCWKTASCCIDKDGIDDKLPVLNCKETLVKKRNKEKVYQGFDHGVRRYYIVDFCPEDKKGSTVDKKCRSEHAEMLEELVWVSDKDSGIIYQNQYCAECHGVKSFVQWQIKTDCKALLKTNFSTLLSDLSYHTCDLNNELPDSIRHIADQHRCFKPSVYKCNQSGFESNFNKSISSACDSIYSPVFQPVSTGHILFRNIFCYLCNSGSVTDFEVSCPGQYDSVKSSQVTFSALVNYQKYAELQNYAQDDDQTANQCRIDEVFDEYVGRCRTLICPLGRTAVYGRCDQVLTKINGFHVQMAYHLKTHLDSNASIHFADRNQFESLGGKITTLFQTSSGLRRSKCQLCDIEVYLPTNTNDEKTFIASFYLFVILYTDTECQLDEIFKIGNAFVEKNWTIYVKDIDHDLVLRSEYSASSRLEIAQVSNMISFTARKLLCWVDFHFSYERFCPAIELNLTNVLSLEKSKQRALLALFEEKQHSHGVLKICLDEYNLHMSQKTSSAALILNIGKCKLISFLFFLNYYVNTLMT